MKNKDFDDFDLVKLGQLLFSIYNRRKRLIFFLFISTFSIGIYHFSINNGKSSSFYLIKCNDHFFQNNNNDTKQIGLEISYNLSNYVTNKNYESLSKMIGVDLNIVKSIHKIKVVNITKNDNQNYFRLYIHFNNNDSIHGIIYPLLNYMNNQPLLQKQKTLNKLFYNQFVKDLQLKINNIPNFNGEFHNNEETIMELIKQKNEILIKRELNEPFYLLNKENNIVNKENYALLFFKYFFYFLFISFTVVLLLEGKIFIEKQNS